MFKQKAIAVLKEGELLANRNLNNYFGVRDYSELLQIAKEKKDVYEYISENARVNVFFDIEIKENQEEFERDKEIIKMIKEQFKGLKTIVLESHNEVKKSYHIIVRKEIENVKALKELVTELFSN